MIYDLYFRATPRRPAPRSLFGAAVQWLHAIRAARAAGKTLDSPLRG